MTVACLLFGHEYVLLREPARLAMRCPRGSSDDGTAARTRPTATTD